ncbi:hypothetical protein Rleg_4377 [Rhizobium leguminosarum bv. trifolii WSM1325]|jgi:hypothetical protein|uniref:Uncharacterized protein n=1 Tax=Rhizobium leguminosarum bv. trifolii (strain WSM1325) TaxID=395491 RepID=C6B212_RHILS|nr:hypothetical protein Rleg_4377 [Rhizobium leguminosarum bv. trifolii WSM1325]
MAQAWSGAMNEAALLVLHFLKNLDYTFTSIGLMREEKKLYDDQTVQLLV